MVEIAKRKSEIAGRAKGLFDAYKEKLWNLIAEFIEEEIGRLGKWAGNIAHFKQKIRKAIVAFALLFGGTTLILIGLADFLARIMYLTSYVAFIFTGFIAIIVGIVYYKA